MITAIIPTANPALKMPPITWQLLNDNINNTNNKLLNFFMRFNLLVDIIIYSTIVPNYILG